MRRRTVRRIRSAALRLALPPISWLAGALPWGIAQAAGRGIGALSWHLSRRERRRAVDHLASALPELGEAERRQIGRRCFIHQGVNLLECLHLLSKGCDEALAHVEVDGWQHVADARDAGRPILILTGHCGNFELLAATLSCRGLALSAIARELEDPALQAALLRLRARFGTESVVRSQPGSARKMLAALRSGGALGILIDQDIDLDGVWVPFFGRLAYTPVGAAEIALRRDAVVLPSFIERLADGNHAVRIEPPMELPSDPTEATALMTAAIERQVRRRPEQWVWMHRRWRRRPEVETESAVELTR